ncbi:MAG TPA: VIT1/CCC1 transporter family protein [Vicinamibacterales bacterium]|nr:VIT1/CCC1 transporter family protein [Vicinamibacterales bacterium]
MKHGLCTEADRLPAARLSLHEEPRGVVAVTRHYIGDLIYGANDGLITTFAVVAAASGGALSTRTVLIVGMANLFADGLSMGVGNYLSIRSRESALAAVGRPEEEARPARHGTATFLAFVAAGAVPLLPYALGASMPLGLPLSVGLTFATLFAVGASRALVTVSRWWTAGFEMLALGLAVALAAYISGAIVSALLGRTV